MQSIPSSSKCVDPRAGSTIWLRARGWRHSFAPPMKTPGSGHMSNERPTRTTPSSRHAWLQSGNSKPRICPLKPIESFDRSPSIERHSTNGSIKRNAPFELGSSITALPSKAARRSGTQDAGESTRFVNRSSLASVLNFEKVNSISN